MNAPLIALAVAGGVYAWSRSQRQRDAFAFELPDLPFEPSESDGSSSSRSSTSLDRALAERYEIVQRSLNNLRQSIRQRHSGAQPWRHLEPDGIWGRNTDDAYLAARRALIRTRMRWSFALAVPPELLGDSFRELEWATRAANTLLHNARVVQANSTYAMRLAQQTLED